MSLFNAVYDTIMKDNNKRGVAMKIKLSICTALLLFCAFFCAVPVLATENGTRAAAIANTLERYQVSPNWQPDIQSNYVLLDELYALVNGFDQQDLDTLGGKYESVKKYYLAYCKAKGISAELPAIYTQAKEQYVPPAAGSCREKANAILSSLMRGNVNHSVQGDIATNSNNIEAMLLLVYDYTDAEKDVATLQECQNMLNYFMGLYQYRGWDTTELDLVFTKTLQPIEGVVLAPVVPQQPAQQTPNTTNIPKINENNDILMATSHLDEDFISGLVALTLWLSLLAGLVIFLKKRNEKHFHT